jgi:hypothetical protein
VERHRDLAVVAGFHVVELEDRDLIAVDETLGVTREAEIGSLLPSEGPLELTFSVLLSELLL